MKLSLLRIAFAVKVQWLVPTFSVLTSRVSFHRMFHIEKLMY